MFLADFTHFMPFFKSSFSVDFPTQKIDEFFNHLTSFITILAALGLLKTTFLYGFGISNITFSIEIASYSL